MGDRVKCPRCGFDVNLENGVCPNCGGQVVNIQTSGNSQVVSNNLNTNNSQVVSNNPNTNNINVTNTDPINSETVISVNENNNTPVTNEVVLKKDLSKLYYIILAFSVLIFLVLMGFIIFKHFNGNKKVINPLNSTTTNKVSETILTKNKGIYTNIINPTNIGNITYGGLLDKSSNKVVDADVEIIRYLSDDEINNFLSTKNYPLNPGFKYAGVEYKVTLNDFDYLKDTPINPTMKVYLFDTLYKNNFFLVNENYYTITPINGEGYEIKNGESENMIVVYQVPIDQNYYICFGENFSSLGCFIN